MSDGEKNRAIAILVRVNNHIKSFIFKGNVMRKVAFCSIFVCLSMQMQMYGMGAAAAAVAPVLAKAAVAGGLLYINHRIGEREKISAYGAPLMQRPQISANVFCDAVSHGSPEQIIDLLAQRVDINAVCPDCSRTPLIAAVERGDLSIVGMLCKPGTDLNKPNAAGERALVLAVRNRNFAIVDCLVNERADITVKSVAQESLDQMETSREIHTLLSREIRRERRAQEKLFRDQAEGARREQARMARDRAAFAAQHDDESSSEESDNERARRHGPHRHRGARRHGHRHHEYARRA